MQVKFLRDFRSKHTQEEFYPSGAIAELPDEACRAMIVEGVAIKEAPEPVVEGKSETTDQPQQPYKKSKGRWQIKP